MPSTVTQQTLLPLKSVQLGRFVLNVDEPLADYFDPADVNANAITNPQTHYSAVQKRTADINFTATLTRLASASHSKRNNVSTRIVSDRVTTYQLDNSGLWFKKAIADEQLRQWIGEAIEHGDDTYMVVGYHTMLDAHVIEAGRSASESFGQLEVPVSAALAATGAVIPIGSMIDPGIGGRNQQGQQIEKQFLAAGEQICAIQYRKLRFKWFSSRDLEKATLEKRNRWKIYWDMRGQEPETHDVVEPELQEELELDEDHERERLGGDDDIFY